MEKTAKEIKNELRSMVITDIMRMITKKHNDIYDQPLYRIEQNASHSLNKLDNLTLFMVHRSLISKN